RHTRSKRDWSSDVCSSDLEEHSLSFRLLIRKSIPQRSDHRDRIPGFHPGEFFRSGPRSCHTVYNTELSLLPIDLTDTDRAREQLAPVVRIHGNKLSRRRFRRRFCPDPHTINIFCDLLLGEDRKSTRLNSSHVS